MQRALLPVHYKWGHTYCTLQVRTHLPIHYKWGHTYLYTTNEDTLTYTLQMRTHLPVHYKWGHTYLYTTNEDTLTCTLQVRTHLPVHYKWGHTYLYTTGDGTQNLTNVFLIFSCRILWSMYQAAWVSPSGPAVGSTVIQIELHLLLRLGYNRIVWCIKLFKNHKL